MIAREQDLQSRLASVGLERTVAEALLMCEAVDDGVIEMNYDDYNHWKSMSPMEMTQDAAVRSCTVEEISHAARLLVEVGRTKFGE